MRISYTDQKYRTVLFKKGHVHNLYGFSRKKFCYTEEGVS